MSPPAVKKPIRCSNKRQEEEVLLLLEEEYEEDEEEKDSEDWCFVCKDGGELRVCDFKDCMKSYHPSCLQKDSTFLQSEERWICDWHSCCKCHKNPKFHCFCCKIAVCKRCIKAASFVKVKSNKGFCIECLELALLIEEDRDVDSEGVKVDFNDRNTCEGLFKEYWEIINEKEGLTLDDLHTADIKLRKGKSKKKGSDTDQEFDADDVNMEVLSYPSTCELQEHEMLSPNSYCRRVNSGKKRFTGWGSRSLIDFLTSIGKDTSKMLSQYEVHNIISSYIHTNKLSHPDKKKKVLCDARLYSLFGRRSVNRNKIYDLLEWHFAENMEELEAERKYYSFNKEIEFSETCKRKKLARSRTEIYEKKVAVESVQSRFASVTAKNIKLVYLRRSLIEYILKNSDTFTDKIIGSFVRIKSDPNNSNQRRSYQLVQVTGTKKASGKGDISEEVLLQVSNMDKDISICMLSDDDIREEEIVELHQKTKDGLHKKIRVVELEEKAQNLHQDVMKHWIERELVHLQHLIDRANEKGWRRELCECLERRQLLKTPSEQMRLLKHVPQVIAEEMDLQIISQDFPEFETPQKEDSPRQTIPKDLVSDFSVKGATSNLIGIGTAIDAASEFYVKSTLPGEEEANGIGDAPNQVDPEKQSRGKLVSKHCGEGEDNGGAALVISGKNKIEHMDF